MRNDPRNRRELEALYIEFNRYTDGCVILSGTLKDRYDSFDYHEKYPTGTTAGRVLHLTANFITRWEKGEVAGPDLWDQLQLPFDRAQREHRR